MATRTKVGKKRDLYLELIRRFPLRPIRSDDQLDKATKVIDSLIDRADLRADEQDYLDVLGDLVEAYEREQHPIVLVSDAEMLRHLMEAKQVSQSQLANDTGIAVSTISEVLAGKRKLTRTHIGKLARYFHVGANAFQFV